MHQPTKLHTKIWQSVAELSRFNHSEYISPSDLCPPRPLPYTAFSVYTVTTFQILCLNTMLLLLKTRCSMQHICVSTTACCVLTWRYIHQHQTTPTAQ